VVKSKRRVANRRPAVLLDTEKAWLAGFLDADGMIRLRIGRKNKNKSGLVGPKSLVPLVTYTNTCPLTVTKLAEMISRAFTGFQATVCGRTPEGWAPKITLEVGGIVRVEPFLQMVRPYMITKEAEADLVLLFCEKRKAAGRGAYTELEYRIFEALKYLKHTRHLRDYTPSIEEILDEGIVRTNAKALEVAETAARQTAEAGKEWARNLVSRYRWNKPSGQQSSS
jgi:hypothetical protein